MTPERNAKIRETAHNLGELLVSKQAQYGDSVGSTGEILRQLYPNGIRPDQYDGLQLVVRMLVVRKRIASQGPDGRDKGGESPFKDLAGFGLLLSDARGQGVHSESTSSLASSEMPIRIRALEEQADLHARPSCRGCKHLAGRHAENGAMFKCVRTNRPCVDSFVELAQPSPPWCPGREERVP